MMQQERADGATLDEATETAGAGNRHPRRKTWLLALTLLAATFVAYQPVWHAKFIWDDDDYVTENALLHSVDGLEKIWTKPRASPQYYPMVFTTFWVEYHVWKLRPFGYHLVNVLLHASNAMLLWCVLRRLKVPGAWWAAASFALHPVMVESVAWVAESKNVLSGLFYLLAVLAYFRFRPFTGNGAAGGRDWRFYPLVLVLFLCALLSKTVTCSLPVVLVLLDWWKTGRVKRRDVLELAPLFVLGAVMGLMTARIEGPHMGTNRAEWALSFVQRCLVAGRVLWFYAGKLCWPSQLMFFYPHWKIDVGAAWQYLFPLGAMALLATLWRLRSRIGKGPLVAVLFFTITLAPALGFVDVYPFRYSYVADHFQYLASIGLITLAAGAGTSVFERSGQQSRRLGALVAAIVLLILGVCTWTRAHAYEGLETLWRDTLAKNPDAWEVYNNLGVLLMRAGKVDEAMRQYEQALRINPDCAEAHFNLGNSLQQAGRVEDAIEHYRRALRANPDYPEPYNNLGGALLGLGKTAEAIACCEQALRLKPDYAEAHYILGNALFEEGRVEEAIAHWEQALQLKPDYVDAHCNLGAAFARLGRLPEAIGQYEQALRLKPDDAETHYNLGVALEQVGKPEEAIGQYEQALKIRPDYTVVQNALTRLRARR